MQRYLKAAALGLALAWVAACGFDPKNPFQRLSPEVDKAIQELDAGQAETSTGRLADYLRASRCDAGSLSLPGPPDAENAAFDLGLSLFKLAEQFGRRFEDGLLRVDGGPDEEAKRLAVLRGDQIDCAKAALDAILARNDLTPELEARARYLRGNLAFLEQQWDDAVKDYDRALHLIPGFPGDAGDGIGRDTAWNRALALRHKEEDEKLDGGDDADADADADGDADADADADADGDADADADADAPDGDADADADAEPDAPDGSKDGPEDGPKEAQADSGDSGPEGGEGDAAGDAPSDGSDEKPAGPDGGQPDAGPAGAGAGNQDDRILDQFEQAPTWQKEEAKARAGSRKVRGMQDK